MSFHAAGVRWYQRQTRLPGRSGKWWQTGKGDAEGTGSGFHDNTRVAGFQQHGVHADQEAFQNCVNRSQQAGPFWEIADKQTDAKSGKTQYDDMRRKQFRVLPGHHGG